MPTAFSEILRRLVESTPGALGAALADEEGEAVDTHGTIDPFELKLAAAHMGIVLDRLAKVEPVSATGRLLEVRIVGERAQLFARPLGRGYQVTVVLEPVAPLPKLCSAFDQALAEIRVEAGGVLDC